MSFDGEHTEKTKKAISEAQKAAWADPKVRARRCKAMKAAPRKSWSDPVLKKKHLRAMEEGRLMGSSKMGPVKQTAFIKARIAKLERRIVDCGRTEVLVLKRREIMAEMQKIGVGARNLKVLRYMADKCKRKIVRLMSRLADLSAEQTFRKEQRDAALLDLYANEGGRVVLKVQPEGKDDKDGFRTAYITQAATKGEE